MSVLFALGTGQVFLYPKGVALCFGILSGAMISLFYSPLVKLLGTKK